MDEQYKKSLEYKKNLCQFTSIDFGYIVRKSQKVKAKKKNILQSIGNYNNIYNATRFKPFIAFDAIPKKSKSNTIKNNRNSKNSTNKRQILTVNDKEKLKKLKEKKIKEEKERKRKEIEKKKKEEEEKKRKEEEERLRKEEEEKKRKEEEEERKRKEEEERQRKEEEERKRKEEERKIEEEGRKEINQLSSGLNKEQQLFESSEKGYIYAVKKLLKEGVNINAKDNSKRRRDKE